MDLEAKLVAIGGLLHDIGKFEQRATLQKKKHQECGYDFLKKYTERYLKEYDKLPLFARYHHKNDLKEFSGEIRTKNLLNIVCEADNISSGERRTEDEMKFNLENPLECVLSSINIGKGEVEKMYYPLKLFSLESYFYPVKHCKNTSDDYRKLFEAFEKEFENAIKNLNFNVLMSVLERYTTFIPTMLTETNDISLYDHLRTTSAIALCLYHYHLNELDKDLERKIEDIVDKKYLVVGGDVSGIQEFIYTITSKGALKYLRARSLFLELLVEDVVMEIIERLNLTRANVIFAGGGRFYILAYNTENARNEIKKIGEEVNKWLLKHFWGKLYFAIDFVEVNGEELSKFRTKKESIWELINRKLKKKKLRKFLDIAKVGDLIENYIPDSENYGECDVCKTPEILHDVDENKVCSVCKEFLEIGKTIPKSDGFVRVPKDSDVEKKYSLPFSIFIPFQSKELSGYPEGVKIYVKELKEIYFGFADRYDLIPISIGGYYSKDDKGNVKEFDELAKGSAGAKKLAVLRMDVDDLGKIFSIGLRDNETISRVATLSRFMNNFFKNCIDLLCKGDVSANAPRIKSERKEKEVVVVYAGGDDLFVVGAWDHVFELAFEIEDAFRKYVGMNPNITISAGYGVFDPKFPLYRMAEVTGDREERAKEEGEVVAKVDGLEIKKKGRVYLGDRATTVETKNGIKFKESYKWSEFRRIWAEYITKIYDDSKPKLLVPRTVLRRILDARKEYLKNSKGFKWSVLLTYYLARVKVGENGKRLIDVIPKLASRDPEKARIGEPQDIYLIDVPLKFVDFADRGGG
ncbi:type III-A CRISPR-associated protein Cas10/Csm1 [Archaeoglobales archaeon]|nr:MAG: type III-A CRISPR-associated protein Cas10/Csm1 [Archaeoglobales archaeon]